MKTLKIVFYVALVVAILYFAYGKIVSYQKSIADIQAKELKDSIKGLMDLNASLQGKNEILSNRNDSLETVKSQVRNHYYTQYEFIKGASVQELDSIIRKRCGL